MLISRMKKQHFCLYGFLTGAALSLLLFILSFLFPTHPSSNYQQKSLDQLRHKASAIKNEFSRVLNRIHETRMRILDSSFPQSSEDIFLFFEQLGLNKDTEGISHVDREGNLILWWGNILDFRKSLPEEMELILPHEHESPRLIHHKASVYLISLLKLPDERHLALFRLLAFLPQFRTPYLKEHHFLKPKFLNNSHVDYWDFREDLSGFENVFSKHEDEYIGQPSLQEEVQTLFFPLRNEKNRIVATITLSSESFLSKLASQREQILLVSYALLIVSLVLLILFMTGSPAFHRKKKLFFLVGIIVILAGLRLLFLPLSRLGKIQSLSVFSPSEASFLSLWDFTKSPADIFLTSLFLFSIISAVFVYFNSLFESDKKKIPFSLSLFIISVCTLIPLFFLYFFQKILLSLVFHSNINLLRFSLNPSFFLLHIGILLFFLAFSLCSILLLRIASLTALALYLLFLFLAAEFIGYCLLLRNDLFPVLFIFQAMIITSLLILAHFPVLMKRKRILSLALLFIALFVYSTIHSSSSLRSQSLLENTLQNIVRSQENWGVYLINQSFPEIDKKAERLELFYENPEPSALAASLWEKTLIAKFNWYSSLEILSPEGFVLSRFSLNIPELFRFDLDLPLQEEWSVSRRYIPFLGTEKDFLIGYKDWFRGEDHLGRVVIYLLVDYDILPFLYSANPYFEVLRATSIPSLDQIDLGIAVFDDQGKLLFNPDKISTGIPASVLQNLGPTQESIWSTFTDRNKKYMSLYFRDNRRIYSLFLPQKNFFQYSVEFLIFLFLYSAIILSLLFVVTLTSRRRRLKSPFWSFSNRVYISFIAIALIPLFLFTFLIRSSFKQIFTQQITEKAETHANFAQRTVEDFMFLQEEDPISLNLPADDVVFWISLTISNDVNLYRDGSLMSSSRREFFDYGILPETIDGETYYKIHYENNPFYAQSQKIGNYSFHTLTVPYSLQDSLLLISLPFPLEQEEISRASRDFIEFLIFITFFFIAVVLLFARGIGDMIVNPIRKLLLGTKEVSMGNLELTIPHKHKDEMKTLIDGFNTMVKSLKKHQLELAEMSKKAAWADMARKVAHEVKNPLTPIQLSAEHLLKVYSDDPENFDEALQESVSYIIKEVENLRKIAKEFLEVSKETPLHRETIDLKEITEETIKPYKKILPDRIFLKESYRGDDFCFLGDREKIRIVLRNVFTNAVEAISAKGEIKITSSSEGNELIWEITDTGEGIDKDTLNRIFEPYFSTKDVGTGLGLPIAKRIIEEHRGTITVQSERHRGTRITIKLPKIK
jgi:signal transduction histidine kinase